MDNPEGRLRTHTNDRIVGHRIQVAHRNNLKDLHRINAGSIHWSSPVPQQSIRVSFRVASGPLKRGSQGR